MSILGSLDLQRFGKDLHRAAVVHGDRSARYLVLRQRLGQN